jgi:O-Antigen ligase
MFVPVIGQGRRRNHAVMGRAGAPAGAVRRKASSAAALLLLAAVATGLLGQGAYYPPVQRYLGVFIGAATVLAFIAWPPARADARLWPALPAVALAGWAIADAAVHDAITAGVGPALLALGVVATLLACGRLGWEDRELVLVGVIGIGLAVAAAGWLGVATRAGSWGWEGQGIWRASSTLSYPNAAAATLAPVALLTLARLTGTPRSLPLTLAATGLLAGLAATASRAGALSFAAGLVVLAVLQGPRPAIRAALGPVVGALLALAFLVPSMPASSPPRPALALAGLAAGLALAAGVALLPRRWGMALMLGGLLAGCVAALAAVGAGAAGTALRSVASARASLDSPDRTDALRAGLRVIAEHPLTGAGPGQAELRWTGSDGATRFFTYVHNEYVQLTAELGVIGLVLLLLLLVGVAGLLRAARSTGPAGATWASATSASATWAGAVAAAVTLAVHSAFDFVWHLPAIPLAVALLVGMTLPAPDGGESAPPATAREAETKGVQ